MAFLEGRDGRFGMRDLLIFMASLQRAELGMDYSSVRASTSSEEAQNLWFWAILSEI